MSSLASKVLMEGQVRYDSATGGEREQLALVLASTYRVAASCANGFGQRDLALSALTSAKLLAKEADDPVVMALLESTLSWIHERVVRWSADGRPSADRMRLHVGPGGHHLMWE
ncbi:hypothetical protein [Streptomyces sp. NPDC018045]|uniref:hypothetical protein n=1 Tax=Streptomyces sp. NPDC018045 TaxID=3365037 RepID=UPI0037983B43